MTEHCGVKAGLAGGMGYLLGCVMGGVAPKALPAISRGK